MNSAPTRALPKRAHALRLLLLGLAACGACRSNSVPSSEIARMEQDFDRVIAVAANSGDAAATHAASEFELRWSESLASSDYADLANALIDAHAPESARAVLDSACRRFASDPSVKARLAHLRRRLGDDSAVTLGKKPDSAFDSPRAWFSEFGLPPILGPGFPPLNRSTTDRSPESGGEDER